MRVAFGEGFLDPVGQLLRLYRQAFRALREALRGRWPKPVHGIDDPEDAVRTVDGPFDPRECLRGPRDREDSLWREAAPWKGRLLTDCLDRDLCKLALPPSDIAGG